MREEKMGDFFTFRVVRDGDVEVGCIGDDARVESIREVCAWSSKGTLSHLKKRVCGVSATGDSLSVAGFLTE